MVAVATGLAALLGASPILARASASTGALVQVIQGSSYGFDDPLGISSDGTDVWVANSAGDSVTELSASTGALVQTISDPSLFQYPVGISSDGAYVWVANYDQLGNSVTDVLDELPFSDPSYGFNGPWAISSDGTNVWVANYLGGSVTELSASTNLVTGASPGDLIQVIPGFAGPSAISSDGTNVWVANSGDNSVTELSASTGALERTISDPSYGFDDPVAISSDGTNVWVANSDGGSVTELSASTGALIAEPLRPQLRLQQSDSDLVRRHQRLGRQLRGLLGDGAVGVHRGAHPEPLRLQLRLRRPVGDLLGRHPRLGRQLRGRFGYGAVGWGWRLCQRLPCGGARHLHDGHTGGDRYHSVGHYARAWFQPGCGGGIPRGVGCTQRGAADARVHRRGRFLLHHRAHVGGRDHAR